MKKACIAKPLWCKVGGKSCSFLLSFPPSYFSSFLLPPLTARNILLFRRNVLTLLFLISL